MKATAKVFTPRVLVDPVPPRGRRRSDSEARKRRPKCDASLELEALVVSALTVLADDRIATAEDFAHRLDSIRADHTDESEPYLFAGCFELLQPLGVGAKGEVYKAYNHDAPSHVALNDDEA